MKGSASSERILEMTGKERREQIIRILSGSDQPVSGASLASQLHVSRQAIVQDIALLRANDSEIFSTNQGYLLLHRNIPERVYKVRHKESETEEELNLFVDHGGYVKDVFVYHKAYGIVKAELNIRSRKDVRDYMDKMTSGKSSMLMNVTAGYHYHTITADRKETLDQIFHALDARGFLVPLQDYEPINFWDTSGSPSSGG